MRFPKQAPDDDTSVSFAGDLFSASVEDGEASADAAMRSRLLPVRRTADQT